LPGGLLIKEMEILRACGVEQGANAQAKLNRARMRKRTRK
jgi:hypothetical protein